MSLSFPHTITHVWHKATITWLVQLDYITSTRPCTKITYLQAMSHLWYRVFVYILDVQLCGVWWGILLFGLVLGVCLYLCVWVWFHYKVKYGAMCICKCIIQMLIHYYLFLSLLYLDCVTSDVYGLANKAKTKFPQPRLVLSGVLRCRDVSWQQIGALKWQVQLDSKDIGSYICTSKQLGWELRLR